LEYTKERKGEHVFTSEIIRTPAELTKRPKNEFSKEWSLRRKRSVTKSYSEYVSSIRE